MKLELGYFGGNMQALEGNYKGIQVLISDGDGGTPEIGKEYAIGFFKKEQGEWSYESFKRIEKKRFNLERAISQAKKAIDKLSLKGKLKKDTK